MSPGEGDSPRTRYSEAPVTAGSVDTKEKNEVRCSVHTQCS